MTYHGTYINLDRSTARRASLETQLALYNLQQRYQRLPAIEGNPQNLISSLKNPQEIGCFLSHMAALREGMQANQHLHIIEDDTIFANCTEQTVTWSITSGALDDFDILYTDVAMPLANDSYQKFKTLYDHCVTRDAAGKISTVSFRTFDLVDTPFVAASSYIVNKNALHKLHQLYQDEVAAGLRVPVDLFLPLQAKAGALHIGCLFPFVTSINVEETLSSTIRTRPDSDKRFTAANIGRYSFFVGCDWDLCERLMQEHIAPPDAKDRHAELLTRLLGFSLLVKDGIP